MFSQLVFSHKEMSESGSSSGGEIKEEATETKRKLKDIEKEKATEGKQKKMEQHVVGIFKCGCTWSVPYLHSRRNLRGNWLGLRGV